MKVFNSEIYISLRWYFDIHTGRVGKTSLTLRYCKGEYRDDQESTINASFLEKKVTVGDNGDAVNLAIWVLTMQNTLQLLKEL